MDTQQALHSRSSHPRRAPADKSVAVMNTTHPHGRRVRRGQAGPASIQGNLPPTFHHQKDSSRDSSNAEKWFEASNNNVPDVTLDNDPPFFLRRSSSSSDEQSPGMNEDLAASSNLPPTHLSFRAASLLRIPTGTNSSDDYRSVIDDLTIENKKLKRKLRKYDSVNDSHLQDDKLFEIRVHSLPADKKKELEDMLRKFAMTLRDASHACQADQPADAIPHCQPSGTRCASPLEADKTSSSHTSTRFGDSAYASMSASGQNSIAPSGHKNVSSQQQSPNIQSYLQHVPAGLMPNHTTVTTEKAKRKLVVRRLEQIFAGKGPAAVARPAARAGKKAVEASGQWVREEGAREAQIMPSMKIDCVDHMADVDLPEAEIPEIKAIDQDLGQSDVPEQRPTRPLDLDPCRAQIPADNIEYIRHLGFLPMDAGSTAPQQDGHGWIYLNLLANMAQLHTINVTADFIRKAIAGYSKKLELSPDGRKVRWRGGADVTRTSSDSSPEDENHLGHPTRLNSTIVSNQTSFTLAYTPLFFHQVDSDEEDDPSDADTSSGSFPQAGFINAGNSSGFMGSGMRTTPSRKRSGDGGPITFYDKANFCTDLSGDPRGRNVALANVTNYTRLSNDPVGARGRDAPSPPQPMLEKRGPLSTLAGEPTEATMHVDQSSPGNEMEIEIDFFSSKPKCPEIISPIDECPNTIEFEASGIGGVLPQDNFAIRVKSRRKIIDDACSSTASKEHHQQQRPIGIPPHLRTILASSRTCATSVCAKNTSLVEEQILSSRRKDLPPSALPPASFFPFVSPDDDDDEGEASEGDESDVENSESSDASVHHLLARRHRPLPAAAPQLMTWPADYDSGSESEEEDNSEEENSEEGDDDNGEEEEKRFKARRGKSVDLLRRATETDPGGIPTREREHDTNVADKLAEEIPAGSSAATAGGGSGFSSPNNERDRSEEDGIDGGRSGQGVVGKRIGLKRTRTSESVVGRVNKSPRWSTND